MAMTMRLATLRLAGLGLCEFCSSMLTLEGLPSHALSAPLKCPQCGLTLGHRSFGYKEETGEEGRDRWVGPDGRWIDVEPTEDFDFPDGTRVTVGDRGQPWL